VTGSATIAVERSTLVSTCACGCGGTPPPGKRYLRDHHKWKSPVEYIEEDRGYITPCWIWQRSLSVQGYGMVRTTDGLRPAHRVLYERERGPIPADHWLPRRCGVRACVHPDHGEPTPWSVQDNYQALPTWHAHQAGVCLQGHPMTPENTITSTSGRTCRLCTNARRRAVYQRTEAVERRRAKEELLHVLERAARPPEDREPGHSAGVTCTRGHRVEGANAKVTKDGRVRCQLCAHERRRRWSERRNALAPNGDEAP
jgi:hypothetical protein